MTGVDRAVRDCRGWSLVGRKQSLTPGEREVAERHLAICRHCRLRLDDESQLRARVWLRGGVVGATVAADVVAVTAPGGGANAAVALVGGKLGAVAVGAAALGVAVTSTGIAVHRDMHPTPVAPAVRVSHHRNGGEQTAVAPQASSSPSHPSAHEGSSSTAPATGPTARPRDTNRSPQSVVRGPTTLLPTTLPTALPSVPVLPLPSVPLPTLTSVLPNGAH